MSLPKELLVKSLGILPQNLISLSVGAVVRAKLPTTLAKPLNKIFVKTFGINMAEAEFPLAHYETIEDVFTRKLQSGARKVANAAFVAPSDGVLVKSLESSDGTAVQAKGISYSLSELVLGSKGKQNPEALGYLPTWFSTVYLAPHNYHRVHAPMSGVVKALRYIPGRLWPVNSPAVQAIPGLFCRNERLVFDLELPEGGKAAVVMVGAMNVGRMTTPLDSEFVSNAVDRQLGNHQVTEKQLNYQLNAGDEIGTFMLGSTVIIVLDEKARLALSPERVDTPRSIKMGQTLIQS
ncbi:MAG: archaetidylserine decarboxylase [Proteobacteria bacterium]|nr:archaetidylserine decarboxylase [Pseudomonadota bacterium]